MNWKILIKKTLTSFQQQSKKMTTSALQEKGLFVYDEIESTMTTAETIINKISSDNKHMEEEETHELGLMKRIMTNNLALAIVANHQTKGQGTRGRIWVTHHNIISSITI